MTELVLDASVLARWFWPSARESATRLRSDFEMGHLTIVVPSLLFLEILNVAGRQWRWHQDSLLDLVERLERASFDVGDPELGNTVRWVARGLTAYDATYVALAEERGIPLVTEDREVLRLAPDVTQLPA